jgi:hypothetical protein
MGTRSLKVQAEGVRSEHLFKAAELSTTGKIVVQG